MSPRFLLHLFITQLATHFGHKLGFELRFLICVYTCQDTLVTKNSFSSLVLWCLLLHCVSTKYLSTWWNGLIMPGGWYSLWVWVWARPLYLCSLGLFWLGTRLLCLAAWRFSHASGIWCLLSCPARTILLELFVVLSMPVCPCLWVWCHPCQPIFSGYFYGLFWCRLQLLKPCCWYCRFVSNSCHLRLAGCQLCSGGTTVSALNTLTFWAISTTAEIARIAVLDPRHVFQDKCKFS